MPLHYTHDYCQDRIYSPKGSSPALNTAQRHTVAHALRGEGFDASEEGTGRGTPIVPECANPLTHRMHKGINTTLDEGQTPIPVAFDLNQITSKTNRSQPDPAVHHTLPATTCPPHLASPMAVRRLTPVECERLQGFPDNFTRIPWRNKPAERCPDGPRYKALGNSMAVNVMQWLGQRIQLVDTIFNTDPKDLLNG